MNATRLRHALGATLLLLALLYAAWFHNDRHRLAALLVFALPPLLLAIGVLRGSALARFWSGVCALVWFSHGVMAAWSHPPQRAHAWAELLLALLVVGLSSAPGLRARCARKRGAAVPAGDGER
ncbi:DUF2069 domain-containing protein [Xanthomonas theicola]|uniref:DUF2069 domain-containing protein n=1 Tax=Xanthomonas theicola TaxID=56464 RepID=A0A2S6ZEQ5_9XANT|nr:DUF2069 domain-containing protein [Xanthomonas theicola]PPT90656.1 hypothetical protein XthCFBP4691_11460 [Xanthomonas theicola]QNH23509.1 DUF2069 domain-containing protein [Xanthomonas theicola]